jgi:hypothetical protein
MSKTWTLTDPADAKKREQNILQISEALQAVHGKGVLRSEKHGLHLYLPSPQALLEDGPVEMYARHLSVNLDKHFGYGQWASRSRNADAAAICHKTGTKYSVSQLLTMTPVGKREGGVDPGLGASKLKIPEEREKWLVADDQGRLVPAGPGQCLPIHELGAGNPAYDYVVARGYDPERLWRQFRVAFCIQETKMVNGMRRGYRPLPQGFADTPQGRLVFYADVKGAQVAWQARILERVTGDPGGLQHREFFHPYRWEWEAMEFRVVLGPWTKLPEVLAEEEATKSSPRPLVWKPAKYMTAPQSQRASLVMGYDAAVAWNAAQGHTGQATRAIVVEGPLDGARTGPPGIPVLGKYVNPEQARLIAEAFKWVVVIADNDAGGDEVKATAKRSLGPLVRLDFLDVKTLFPAGEKHKDVGEASEQQITKALKAIKFI